METLFTNFSEAVRHFSIAFIPAFLGIILHELGHGWMALRQGDPTARLLGRLTLNPLPHIDPVGLLVFVVTSLSGSFVFGWAKPVPVNPRYFRRPWKGLMMTALAGPCVNLLLALLFAALLKLTIVLFPPAQWLHSSAYLYAVTVMQMGMIINIGLGVFNLLPVPPLDGSKVISYFLPPSAAISYLRVGRWGFLILVLLLVSGVASMVLMPLIKGCFELLTILFAIS